jgi:hypothetical protein
MEVGMSTFLVVRNRRSGNLLAKRFSKKAEKG